MDIAFPLQYEEICAKIKRNCSGSAEKLSLTNWTEWTSVGRVSSYLVSQIKLIVSRDYFKYFRYQRGILKGNKWRSCSGHVSERDCRFSNFLICKLIWENQIDSLVLPVFNLWPSPLYQAFHRQFVVSIRSVRLIWRVISYCLKRRTNGCIDFYHITHPTVRRIGPFNFYMYLKCR